MWFSLLAKGCDSETRVLLATVHKLDDADDQTWPSIIASFEQLAKPIEGDSWGGILLFLGSDLEYVCNILGWPHFNAKSVCGLCLANDGAYPHTDNSRGAA